MLEPQFALEGSVFVGGAVVQWLRDGLRAIGGSGTDSLIGNTVDSHLDGGGGDDNLYWNGGTRDLTPRLLAEQFGGCRARDYVVGFEIIEQKFDLFFGFKPRVSAYNVGRGSR